MRRLLSVALALAVLTATPVYIFSQTKSSLSGIVTDSSKKPLSFVTVRFFKLNNPTPLQTILSKDNGTFLFNRPDTGNYIIKFTHTGFEERQVNISITTLTNVIQIDPVLLSIATGTLKEVAVKSERPLIEQADDKIVFNVEDDPATRSETALDILRKTPFVTVDGQDNVQVNGKTNFKVLLNGRETSMFANNVKDALRGFPGALISKIEVITTPSAKYDGEGIGGLINIITKKKIAGYNGTLSSFSRTSDKLNSMAVNANAKIGKLGATLFFVDGGSSFVPQQNVNTTVPITQSLYTKRTLSGNQQTSGNWNFGNAELSWEMDSLNTLSVYANSDGSSNTTLTGQTITTEFASAPADVSYYNLNNRSNSPGISVGTDYIKHFSKNKDQEFSLRFFGDFGKSDSYLNSTQSDGGSDRYLINNSNAINNQYTFQADNSLPINKTGKLDAGVKAILRRASSDFESLIKYDPASDYKTNPFNTDNFKYSQDVISAYGMYTLKIKKSTFRFGTRAEYTNVNGDFIASNTQVKHSYTTLLPNLQFTNRLNPTTTFVLSYNKRLQRPYINDLNPFVYNNDSLNISYGNPNLGPQTIHVLSAQIRHGNGTTFYGLNIEGSYSDNKILQYSSFNSQSGVTTTTSLNIGKEFQSSLNFNLNTSLTKKWRLFVNGSLRYSTVTNNSNASQSNSGFGGNFNLNNSYTFSKKFSMSAYLGLWKDPITIQTTYPFSTWYNLAFNYKILHEKVNISLRTVNFFEKTHDYKTVINDPNYYNTNITTQIRRGAVLALSWNFGKLTENVSKKKGVNNDDLLTKQQPTSGN